MRVFLVEKASPF